jgi:hypothetical protein
MDTILKFGKFKGQKLSETPSWYQEWLPKQDWYKPTASANTTITSSTTTTSNEARYDVVKWYTSEYRSAFGITKEVEVYNLSWDEAEEQKNLLNLFHLDDTIKCFGIENRR